MTRDEIEARIRSVERLHSEARSAADLRLYAGLLEKLIMMEADDDE